MRLKKFVCYRCGAPKINSYTKPYIVCDFCGTLMDLDWAIGFAPKDKTLEETRSEERRVGKECRL